ncbi:putative phosphatase regulatory subunit-domain-containing protein [Roridomyces roridus]|uniref:Phosphatase regulatory subunit-domain-containing protein n=1 Tax=Roridomyces roridus TaxID=1738132 RepID=A0AAD7FXF0_9AGAR|nr:putative phosphatase regulatory subunit-domain-containing protein [Roridomyces roridus]
MPYSVPGVVAPPPPTAPPYAPPRPSHRRSYTFAANDPTNHGAFTPLGSLPRRSRSPAQFHFRADEDDSSESSDDKHDDEDDGPPPPLRLKQPQPAFRLTPPTTYVRKRSPPSSSINVAVPFPRSSPVPSPTLLSPLPTPQRPAGPARTASHPVILLSNGKPLKSSLKSSSSAPHMSAPSQHLRARSAPSTPSLSSSLSSLASSSASNSDAEDDQNPWDQMGGDGSPFSPGTPKAVHFPAPSEGLETVLLFRRGARPAAVSLGSVVPGSEDTETETETDRDVGVRWRSASLGNGGRAAGDGEGFPFPRLAAGGSPLRPPIPSQFMAQAKPWRYALDGPALVGRVPGRESMVFLESAELCQPSFSTTREGEVKLKGTLIARNAAFEKHVYVRFTLDGWSTTSEVCAKWLEAVTPQEEEAGPGWDRFTWEIRLTDYAAAGGRRGRGLEGRRLEMVVRVWMPWVERGSVAPYVWSDSLVSNPHAASQSKYWVGTGGGGSGEWWDNNGGTNYVVVFQVVHDDARSTSTCPRCNAACESRGVYCERYTVPDLGRQYDDDGRRACCACLFTHHLPDPLPLFVHRTTYATLLDFISPP